MSHPVWPLNHSGLTAPPERTARAHPSPSGEQRRWARLDGAVSCPFLCRLLWLRADRVLAIAPRIQKPSLFNHEMVCESLIKPVEVELISEALESCSPPPALVSAGASGARPPPKQTSEPPGCQQRCPGSWGVCTGTKIKRRAGEAEGQEKRGALGSPQEPHTCWGGGIPAWACFVAVCNLQFSVFIIPFFLQI